MSRHYTILIDETAWRLGVVADGATQVDDVPCADDATRDARIEAVRQQLAALGHCDEPIVLALPSSWCLCATISTEDLERSGRRQAMGFRLEEHLPISVEDVVVDYLDLGEHQAMGVCGELDMLKALVDAFEAAGLHVRHICPAALLAAAYAAEQHHPIDSVLIQQHSATDNPRTTYDLIELRKATPTHWWWLADDDTALVDRLTSRSLAAGQPLRLAVFETGQASPSLAKASASLELVAIDNVTADQAASHCAARILDDAAPPWIDLRRDALAVSGQYAAYRKPIGALVLAALLLLASLLGVTQWRGRQHQALAAQYKQQQVEQFRRALPDQSPPAAVNSRLRSEHQKLAGLGGQGAGADGSMPARSTSALSHLHRLLSNMQTETRYRVLELTIEPDLIRVDGQARTYAEAEQLASALRASGAYEVAPPETRALQDRGVNFLFTATPRDDDATQADANP